MANYVMEWDEAIQVIRCKVTGFLPDSDAEAFASDLARMVGHARKASGPLRLLIDNHEGAVFSARAAEALVFLKTLQRPGDRSAVIAAGNLNTLQAIRSKSELTELFTSEAEALAWLKS